MSERTSVQPFERVGHPGARAPRGLDRVGGPPPWGRPASGGLRAPAGAARGGARGRGDRRDRRARGRPARRRPRRARYADRSDGAGARAGGSAPRAGSHRHRRRQREGRSGRGAAAACCPRACTSSARTRWAGSHRAGVEYADADLFVGRRVVVTPTEGTDPVACDRIVAFWRALGAEVALREPEVHDAEVAWTSHVPHLIRVRLRGVARRGARRARASSRAAASTTSRGSRRSGPELWADILTTNGKALRRSTAALQRCASPGWRERPRRATSSRSNDFWHRRGRCSPGSPRMRRRRAGSRCTKMPDPGATTRKIQAAPDESSDPKETNKPT